MRGHLAVITLLLAASAGAARSSQEAVSVKIVALPDFWGSYAIWGATGNDRQGRIWIGVTSNDEKSASAHLFEFDPVTHSAIDRGNVMAELERVRPRKPGERQMKIHSRIVQMPDG
jgi:hypothetical protein